MKYRTRNFFLVPIFSTRKPEFQLAFCEFTSMSVEPWSIYCYVCLYDYMYICQLQEEKNCHLSGSYSGWYHKHCIYLYYMYFRDYQNAVTYREVFQRLSKFLTEKYYQRCNPLLSFKTKPFQSTLEIVEKAWSYIVQLKEAGRPRMSRQDTVHLW